MIWLLLLACRNDPVLDLDGDGWLAPEDCDDQDASVHPNAEELCDGLDQDCDGEVDEDAIDMQLFRPDEDGDGYGGAAVLACEGVQLESKREDCDDSDPAVHPDAEEVCNGLDDDCDGLVDDEDKDLADPATWYRDEDEDGYGDPAQSTEACEQPSGYLEDNTDCDDDDPQAYPGAEEVAYDGTDQDCDGFDLDDLDGDGSPWPEDCDDEDPNRGTTVWEVCDDGIDNDCDEEIDTDCQYFGGGEVSGDPLTTIYGEVEKGECCGSKAGLVVLAGADLDGDDQSDLAYTVTDGDGAVRVHLGPLAPGEQTGGYDHAIDDPFGGGGGTMLHGWDHNEDGAVALIAVDSSGDMVYGFDLASGASEAAFSIEVDYPDAFWSAMGSGNWLLLNGSQRIGSGSSREYYGFVALFSAPLADGESKVAEADVYIVQDTSQGGFGMQTTTCDLEGNGVADLVAGDPRPLDKEDGVTTYYTPQLYAFLDPTPGSYTPEDADLQLDWTIAEGLQDQVLDCVDVRGDGSPDLLRYLRLANESDDGHTMTYSVFSDLPDLAVSSPSLELGSEWPIPYQYAEEWSTELMDLDSDGHVDFLLGLPGAGNEGDEDYGPGMVYAVFGPISGTVLVEDVAEGWLTGSHAPFELCETDGCMHIGAHFGTQVANGQDLNGDGEPDFLVGAPYYEHDTTSNKKGPGAVYLYEGGPRP